MGRGGKRPGAGRPRGRGKFGEATQAIRVPISQVEQVRRFLDEEQDSLLPLYSSRVSAGSPSPVNDDNEEKLNLHSYLIKRPSTTFFVSVSGDSMIKAGIHPGDILVVDRSLEPQDGKIVIIAVDGCLTVKRLSLVNNRPFLVPENDAYSPIALTEDNNIHIWGIVTNVIHTF